MKKRCIKIRTMSIGFEGNISLKQLEIIINQLLHANKEISIGSWSEKKSNIIDIRIFMR